MAQHTTVSAQVKDANNSLYRNCTGSANFIGQNTVPGAGPYLLGGGVFQTVVPIACDGSANFQISLADNNQITPTPSQWSFAICSAIGAYPGPPICFTALITITGATQSITTNLQSVAALLPTSGSAITLETNGVINGSQALLNLIQGTNITITDNGVGGITINSSGGGGGGGSPGAPTNSLQYNNGVAFAGTADANGNSVTSFDSSTGRINPCNIDNVRYASCFNWGPQTPGGSLTGGTPATVTLTPGPRGIDTTNSATFPFYVYVASVGTPEAVLVTGGTCTFAGSASCTIQFTPANSHGPGFTVQSATAGHAEAALDSSGTNQGPMHINTRPAATTGGNNVNNSIFYAPWFVRCSYCVLDGNGGSWALNNTRAVIVIPSVNSAHVTIQNVRFMPMITPTHVSITNTACAANVATITSTLNPPVGSMVDVQLTNNPAYWGPHIVTTTSPTQWTFTKTGCSIGSETTAGANDYQLAMIEDNGSGTEIHNVGMSYGASPYDKYWNNGIVILNDQAGMKVDHLTVEGHGSCQLAPLGYCGSVIYSPGDFVVNPAVVVVKDSNISPSCSLNGVTAFNGNTVSISDTINQGFAMWAYNGGTQRGGFGGSITYNQYEEVGACTNPLYTPNQLAGVITSGNTFTWLGGEGPQKIMPTFATGGATTYYYYLVVNDSVQGPTAPLYIGSATPSGSTVAVKWPRAQDTNVTTYDILRTTDASNAPTTSACSGGSTSACGSVTLAQAQCNGTLQCSFTDDVTVNTSSYTVSLPEFSGSGIGGATYSPNFFFFPGGFILQGGAVLNYQGGNVGGNAIGSTGTVMATNGVGPIITDSQFFTVPRSYIRIAAMRSNTAGSTMLKLFDPSRSGGTVANSVGRIAIINPAQGTTGHSYGNGSYLLTLASPNSDQLVAAGNPRDITASANDTGIGLDVGGSNANLFSTGYASPVAHDFYVASLLDGTSWKLRIASLKSTWNTPTQFNQPINSLVGCSGCGPFNQTTAPTLDTLNRSPGAIGANWTTLLGSWSITAPGTAFTGRNYAYFDTITNEGGINRAYTFYSAVSFTSDQWAQAEMTSANTVTGLCVRMQNSTPFTSYCYEVGSGIRTLAKWNAGTGVALVALGGTIAADTVIKITAFGSVITVYENGTQVAQATDTTITGGAPGLYGQNFVTTATGVSNFYADSAGWTATEGLTITSLAPKTLTDGATITWNLLGFSLQNSTVTLGGNRTLNITNPATGGNYVLRIVQDGTGGRTLALGTGCTWKVVNGGAGAITLTAAANSIDILTFYYDGTNCYANLGTNYN